MNGLDLFSGIGGISIALSPWVTTIAYCERDEYCQSVLKTQIRKGRLDEAPIFNDVTKLEAKMLPIIPEIIYGGFPCQDISIGGHGVGLAGERSGLFFEIARLVSEIRPRFVFLENVSAINVRGGAGVVGELCRLRYDCRWGIVSARDVGAPHQRERWFLLAHAISERRNCLDESKKVGRTNQYRQNSHKKFRPNNLQIPMVIPIGEARSGVHRVDDGIPEELDRIKCLGNSVVPAQAREAFERLMGLK